MKDCKKYEIEDKYFITAVLSDSTAYDNYTTVSLKLYRADESDVLIAKKKFNWPEQCLPNKATLENGQTIILEGENNVATIPILTFPGHSTLYVGASELSMPVVPVYKSFKLHEQVSQSFLTTRLSERITDKDDESSWNELVDLAKQGCSDELKLPVVLSTSKQSALIKAIRKHANDALFGLVVTSVTENNLITSAKASYKFVELLISEDCINEVTNFVRSSKIVYDKTYALCLKLANQKKSSKYDDLLLCLLEKPINRSGLAVAISMEMSEMEVANLISRLTAISRDAGEELLIEKVLSLMSIVIDSHSQRFVWDDQCHQKIQKSSSEISEIIQVIEGIRNLNQKLEVNEKSDQNDFELLNDYTIRKIKFDIKLF